MDIILTAKQARAMSIANIESNQKKALKEINELITKRAKLGYINAYYDAGDITLDYIKFIISELSKLGYKCSYSNMDDSIEIEW